MGRFKRKFGDEEGGGKIEFVEMPVPESQQSNALLVAAKNNVGGKYKAGKFDEDKKGGKGKKK